MVLAHLHAMGSRPYLACLFAATYLLAPPTAWAQPAARDGLFLSVPNPITDVYVQQVNQKVETAFKGGRNIKVVVFDFNPTGHASGTSAFGSCHDLAELILSLSNRVPTVAYVSNEVTQHTVLPVLACGELWMSEARDDTTKLVKAKIGDIRRGQDLLKQDVLDYYRMIAKKRGLGDLVERMINKDLPLKKVKTAQGTLYLQSVANLPEKSYTIEELPADLTPGKSLFDANLARQLSLCKKLVGSRELVARDLGLPRKVLTEDWLMGRTPVVWRIDFSGETSKGNMESLERRIKNALSRGANFIILQLEGSTGELTDVASTAEFITSLKDHNGQQVKTVAYLRPGASLGAATFLALACSEIVMAEDAVLADFSYLQNLSPADLKLRRDMLVPLAKKQGYPWRLFEASLDPNLILYWAQPRGTVKGGGSGEEIKTFAELEEDARGKKEWDKISQITDGQFLKINANLAKLAGVAQVLNAATLESLYALYGLDSSKVKMSRDDWLDRVAEFFRRTEVGFILVMLGIIGLILELKMPGTAVPGVLAAICFVLFFWSYSFVGEFTMLAVLALHPRHRPAGRGDLCVARFRLHGHRGHHARHLQPGPGDPGKMAQFLGGMDEPGHDAGHFWHEPGRGRRRSDDRRLVPAEHSVRQPPGAQPARRGSGARRILHARIAAGSHRPGVDPAAARRQGPVRRRLPRRHRRGRLRQRRPTRAGN